MAVGQNRWYHFGVGAPCSLGVRDFDPWPNVHLNQNAHPTKSLGGKTPSPSPNTSPKTFCRPSCQHSGPAEMIRLHSWIGGFRGSHLVVSFFTSPPKNCAFLSGVPSKQPKKGGPLKKDTPIYPQPGVSVYSKPRIHATNSLKGIGTHSA